MKGKKAFLISIYVVLLLLLLLGLIRSCNHVETPPPVSEWERHDPPADPENRASGVGHDGRLKITLLWDFPGDIDLHVIEPNTNEICYSNKIDAATGGYLDVDNIPGGSGSAENIYWETPPTGHYAVSLVYYSANPSRPHGGMCTVVVKRDVSGQPVTETFNVNMSVPNASVRIPVTEFNVY